MLTLSQLFIYPVKSLSGVKLSSALLTDRGLQYDRRWMLVDDSGNFISQREQPTMALLAVTIVENGWMITHKMTTGSFIIPFTPQSNQTMMVDVWSDRCRATVGEATLPTNGFQTPYL